MSYTIDGPFLTASVRDTEVTVILGAGEDPETMEQVDAVVKLNDGSRWSATCMSLAQIGRIMDRWTATGEYDSGCYFQCPDLVIVRRPGVPAVLEMIGGLLDSDDFRFTFVELEDEE